LDFLAVFLRAAAFVTRAFFRFPPALRLAFLLVAIAASPNADSALTHS